MATAKAAEVSELNRKLKLADDKKLEMLQALAEQNDRKTRRAREIFRRPAFEGTELAPHRQQDPERNN